MDGLSVTGLDVLSYLRWTLVCFREAPAEYSFGMPADEDNDPILVPQRALPPYERDGYKVLDEYKSSDPALGDALVLEHLKLMGADLSKPRHVVHYFYFPSEEARARIEIKLRGANYQTRFGVAAQGEKPWSLIAERTGIVDEKRITEERELFTQIVTQENGDYDGWEAQLD
jgi:hypothetical protein